MGAICCSKLRLGKSCGCDLGIDRRHPGDVPIRPTLRKSGPAMRCKSPPNTHHKQEHLHLSEGAGVCLFGLCSGGATKPKCGRIQADLGRYSAEFKSNQLLPELGQCPKPAHQLVVNGQLQAGFRQIWARIKQNVRHISPEINQVRSCDVGGSVEMPVMLEIIRPPASWPNNLWSKLLICYPSGSRQAPSCPKVADMLPNRCRTVSPGAEVRPNSGPTPARIGRCCGRCSTESDQPRPKTDQLRKTWLMLARHEPVLANGWPNSTKQLGR